MLRYPGDVRLESGTLSFVPMKSCLSTPDWGFSFPRLRASFSEYSIYLYLVMSSKIQNIIDRGTSGSAES